jgi:hypothetical protein
MNIFKKSHVNKQPLTLRLICVMLYACMFVTALSVQADIRYLEETHKSDNSTFRVELVEEQAHQVGVSDNVEDNTSQYDSFAVPFSSTVNIGLESNSALESHFAHCFNFISNNRAPYLCYLYYQSGLVQPI